MKLPGKLLVAVVSTLMLGVWLALPAAQAQNQPAQARPALSVYTVLPESLEWPSTLSANGNIMAWQEASVSAEANGLRLVEVRANVGDRVRKGDVLALLQSDTIRAELEQIKAGQAEADALLAEARANAERARQLEKTGMMSNQQVIQYLTAEQTAAARGVSLKAQWKSAQIRLAQTRILAPDNGTISQRSATLGAVVSPGTELYRLIRADRLEWRAEVPAADLVRVKPGQGVRVITPGKQTVSGRVRMVAPTVEHNTRNGLVYVDLEAHADARAGMFARGDIEIGRTRVLTVPQTAVLLRDGFSYVFRVASDGRVAQVKVSLGQRIGDRVAVTAGLAAGVPVVATGVGFLADGDLVRLVAAKPR